MDRHGDSAPAYRADQAIRSAAPESPVAALADIEVWKARKTYPSVLFAGGPVFGAARELGGGGWEVLPSFEALTPQDARDRLGAYFRGRARTAAGDGGEDARAAYLAAAERLDWEPLDELTVHGVRHRVVRAERFVRMGPDGPEPPRLTDPDPAADAADHPDPAAGLVIVPADAAEGPEGILKAELLAALGKNGGVPGDVRADSRRAADTHPGVVLLPATFMTAEREGGHWHPDPSGAATTPRVARVALAMRLRIIVPWQKDLGPEETEVYRRAAERLDTERCHELAVAGRHFRVVRVERLVRVGPDGPEGPRRSDPDPPALVEDRGQGEPGALTDEEREEQDARDEAAEERAARFAELFEQERRRREALRGGTSSTG